MRGEREPVASPCGGVAPRVALPVVQGLAVCSLTLRWLQAEDGSPAAQPAWHALSSGKSAPFHKEQVGEKAQHCRAHRAAVRGGIPLKRIGPALKINSSLTAGFLKP